MSMPARTTRIEPIAMASADGKAEDLLDDLAAPVESLERSGSGAPPAWPHRLRRHASAA
jgi:hypothetical protein